MHSLRSGRHNSNLLIQLVRVAGLQHACLKWWRAFALSVPRPTAAAVCLLLHPHRRQSNDVFSPRTISRERASNSLDCVSEFMQLGDGAWWLPIQADNSTAVTPNVLTFAECVAQCPAGSDCQLVTYDYIKQTCTVRAGATVVYEG